MKIMTPGPTQIRENVRLARSRPSTNPDLDLEFYDYYKETCQIISRILHTDNTTYILSGEGILGLEAACASITEPGDRVLVIDNGVFGKYFSDFVTIYGGIPVFYTADYEEELNVDSLREFLEKDHDFKYATVVHCDTPSGVLNDIGSICPLLHEYGILSVVDSVSGMFGNEFSVSESHIDLLCGGSQKALSAPIGLTFVTLSREALKAMENRKTPVASFYANLNIFKDYYENKWFPYSMPASDIYGLRAALENLEQDTSVFKRHKKIASATRTAITNSGLELFLKNGFSNTVTVVKVPENIEVASLLELMKNKFNIMIAGSFDVFTGKVFRIGHMGENANIPDMTETLEALDCSLRELGVPLHASLKEEFLKALECA